MQIIVKNTDFKVKESFEEIQKRFQINTQKSM